MASQKQVSQDKDQLISLLINQNTKVLSALFKEVVDSSEKILIVLTDNKVVYLNPLATKTLGFTQKDFKQKNADELILCSKNQVSAKFSKLITSSVNQINSEPVACSFQIKNGHEKCFMLQTRKVLWKGRQSILVSLNELDTPKHLTNLLERNDLAFEASKQGVWDYNIVTGDFFIGPSYLNLLGYKSSESNASIKTWLKLLHPNSLTSFNTIIAGLKLGKDIPKHWEYMAYDRNKNLHSFLAIWGLVEWTFKGEPSRIVGIHINTDELDPDNLESSECQKILKSFISNSLDGIVIINEKGIVEEWNKKIEEITLLKGTETIGKYLGDIQKFYSDKQEVISEYIDPIKDYFTTISHTGKNPWEGKFFEREIVLKNLEHKIVQESLTLIKTQRGVKVAAIVKDITETKTYSTKIEKSEERLKLALTAGNVGIWDVDLLSGEKYFSPMIFTIFGYRPWEVEPSQDLLKKIIHPDDIAWVLEEVQNLVISGSSLELEFRVQNKGGGYIWILSKNRMLRNESNKSIRITGTITNITRQKKVEAELTANLNQHTLISDISYVLNTNENFALKNNQVIELLGKFTNASRVYIFENNPTKGITSNTYEWCNIDISPQVDDLQEFPLDVVLERIEGKDYIESVNLKHEKHSLFSQLLYQQNILSILVFPLKVSGKLFGFIGFDECTQQREWKNNEIELLKTISNLIAFSYERELIQKHYQLNKESYNELTHKLPQIIFEVSVNGKIDFLNQAGCEFFGFNRDRVHKGLYVWNFLPLREVSKIRSMLNMALNSITLEPIQLVAKSADKSTKKLIVYVRPRMVGGDLVNFSGLALEAED